MKITDIKQQVKRAGRYSIFVDGKYSFSLSESELLEVGLKINQEFSSQELDQLQQTAVEDKAYMRSLDLLARRPRSEWEMRDYLKRKDYEEPVIQVIIDKLTQRDYINDKKFAESWIQNRRLLKNTSKRKLWQELKQKRVSDETINQVLEADETDELAVLKELIAKKRTQTRYQDTTKLMQYLIRQGFMYQDVKASLQDEQ